jgi:hypothetical protein
MTQPYRVIVAGTRTFNDYELLRDRLNLLLSNRLPNVAIVSGCAKGADQLGERYAAELGLEVHRYPADWNRYGKSAGPRRNALMADNADACVVFWDNKSRGTANMINIAYDKEIPLRVVFYLDPITKTQLKPFRRVNP